MHPGINIYIDTHDHTYMDVNAHIETHTETH